MAKSFLKFKGKNNSKLFIAISIILFLIIVYLIYKNSTNERFQYNDYYPPITIDGTSTRAPTTTRRLTTTKAPITIDGTSTRAPTTTIDGTSTRAPTTTIDGTSTTGAPTTTSRLKTTKAPTTIDGTSTRAPTTTTERLCEHRSRTFDGRRDLCQCDDRCGEGNKGCCSDKHEIYPLPTDTQSLAKQAARGAGPTNHPLAKKCNTEYVKCGEFIRGKPCQCDKEGKPKAQGGYGDWCDDYEATCKATTPTPP